MSRKKKNIVIEKLPIESVAAEGKCVARHENKVVFVEGVAPGDVVDVRVKRKKKSFLEAYPIHFHEYSKLRVQPFCKHFGTCGGCKWQHLTYEQQLHYKQQQVTDNLQRIAKVELPEISPIMGSQQTTYYRNKLEFTFSNKRWITQEEINSAEELDRDALGFHIPGRFDKILAIDHCYLQPEPSNEIRLAVDQYAKANQLTYFDLVEQEGLLRNLIIRTANTGQVMVILQFYYDSKEEIEGLLKYLQEKFPQITSLQYVINPKGNETFHDLEVKTYSGEPYITEEMEGLKFRVGPKSFYQTNAQQAYDLYKVTRDLAGLKGHEIVYDLYTGTGTIANFVAKGAKEVIGMEYVAAAIEDAKINSQINSIENTRFYAGDIKDLLDDGFMSTHPHPDVVITDPPRAGMHADVIKMLLKVAPKRIVYVSCNPATQARDLALLDEKYSVKAVQPVDMFPHTYHVENVVMLELKS
ncbi:23S rRNA (uracil(1939)-C(5))-methyltransferase RlmD [Xanthovirga aplysinae]|uniref:23S rRNA (uracil(1939)-C(5))-methyltransferase RlmD n=1 Tax=Xanthovirga aplysinae TaxID=2529853 RepID=UPI001656FE99|nr:23S rRNA (uracil(1939)-C(5))-methyltransferase RlmD [Xanthovirga aplysinae]